MAHPVIALAFGILVAGAQAAPKAPRAPDFSVATLLGAPNTKVTGLNDLAGKVVYLEFWATWCPPCVAGIPRTNRLIDHLVGEPFVVLFVTDEPESKIRPWMKTHEVKAWVGIDVENKTLGPYKVRSRPRGFLIGKDGGLLAEIYPESLTEADVRAALAGTFVPRPVVWDKKAPPKTAAVKRGPSPVLELTVSTGPLSKRTSMGGGRGHIEMEGFSLKDAVAWAWDVSSRLVILESSAAYAVNAHLSAPPGTTDEEGRRLLQGALLAGLGVTVNEEPSDTDVFLLTALSGPSAPRPPLAGEDAHPGLMSWGGGRLLGDVTMAEAAKALCLEMDTPVVDETGLGGVWSLDLEWDSSDAAARDKALAAVGLRLVPARRRVTFYRVSH